MELLSLFMRNQIEFTSLLKGRIWSGTTKAYAPPESNDIDSREAIIPQKFDAYSFGVTLAELLFNAYGCQFKYTILYTYETDIKKYWKYIKKELAELGAKKWITFIKPCFSFFPEERPKFAKLWKKIEEDMSYNILKWKMEK